MHREGFTEHRSCTEAGGMSGAAALQGGPPSPCSTSPAESSQADGVVPQRRRWKRYQRIHGPEDEMDVVMAALLFSGIQGHGIEEPVPVGEKRTNRRAFLDEARAKPAVEKAASKQRKDVVADNMKTSSSKHSRHCAANTTDSDGAHDEESDAAEMNKPSAWSRRCSGRRLSSVAVWEIK
jgi:hypothetical protein